MTMVGRIAAFIGSRMGGVETGDDSPLASFSQLPLKSQLVLTTRFIRGLWLARKFDSRGLIEAGRRVKIDKHNGEIHMQRLCRLMEDVHIAVVGKGSRAVLSLGYDVGIAARTKVNVMHSITIGEGCRIGWDCDIMDSSFHRIEWLDRAPSPLSEPILIEDNVWVGAHTIILQGVTIGANSVIGAGSVVTKDIPSGCFAAGVPARPIAEIAGWDRKTHSEGRSSDTS